MRIKTDGRRRLWNQVRKAVRNERRPYLLPRLLADVASGTQSRRSWVQRWVVYRRPTPVVKSKRGTMAMISCPAIGNSLGGFDDGVHQSGRLTHEDDSREGSILIRRQRGQPFRRTAMVERRDAIEFRDGIGENTQRSRADQSVPHEHQPLRFDSLASPHITARLRAPQADSISAIPENLNWCHPFIQQARYVLLSLIQCSTSDASSPYRSRLIQHGNRPDGIRTSTTSTVHKMLLVNGVESRTGLMTHIIRV